MKRVLPWLLGVVGTLVVLALGLFGWVYFHAFADNAPIPDGSPLSPMARLIEDGFVDVTVLDLGGGSIALVDAGKDPSGHAILEELKKRQLGPEAVKAILITHGHGDHIGACALFRQATLYALGEEVPLIQGLARPRGQITQYMKPKPTGLRVGHVLHDGDRFTLGDRRVEVFAVPGHTEGSAVYLVDDVLYFGDSAGSTKSGQLKAAVDLFSDDPALNVKSLKALAERLKGREQDIRLLSFAHSGPLPSLKPLLDFAHWTAP